MPGAATCSQMPSDNWTAKSQDEGRVRAVALHGAAYAGVSRSREKAPINPVFGRCLERENAGQWPVPYARDPPASVSIVAGAGFEPATFGL